MFNREYTIAHKSWLTKAIFEYLLGILPLRCQNTIWLPLSDDFSLI
jgi:hypothetical protein